jgi:hypothetical protein
MNGLEIGLLVSLIICVVVAIPSAVYLAKRSAEMRYVDDVNSELNAMLISYNLNEDETKAFNEMKKYTLAMLRKIQSNPEVCLEINRVLNKVFEEMSEDKDGIPVLSRIVCDSNPLTLENIYCLNTGPRYCNSDFILKSSLTEFERNEAKVSMKNNDQLYQYIRMVINVLRASFQKQGVCNGQQINIVKLQEVMRALVSKFCNPSMIDTISGGVEHTMIRVYQYLTEVVV